MSSYTETARLMRVRMNTVVEFVTCSFDARSVRSEYLPIRLIRNPSVPP